MMSDSPDLDWEDQGRIELIVVSVCKQRVRFYNSSKE